MVNHDTVHKVADNIAGKYDILLTSFNDITLCAKEYFEKRMYQDLFLRQQERYRLYGKFVREVFSDTQQLLGDQLYNIEYWKAIKKDFSKVIKDKPHKLNSETFYNSITRKVFVDKSFNSDYEFFDYTDYKPMPKYDTEIFDTIECTHFSKVAIKQMLQYFKYNVPFEDIDRDAQMIFDEMAPTIIHQKSNLFLDRIEILKPVFYRNRGAFVVGRIFYKNWSMPIVIPLLNEEKGIFVDSVIYIPADISIIFSFTRASFFVYTKYPAQLIDYMKAMLTHKTVGELYDSIGYYRHGKTILYRDLMNYIHNHDDKFIIAPGIKVW
jgi:isocitrate dehydrogenase kinase/phosphatase